MNYYLPEDSHLKLRSRRFVHHMFMMRQTGTILCFFPILTVLMEIHRGAGFSALLFVNMTGLPLVTCYILVISVTSYNLTWQLRKRKRIALMGPGL